MKKNISILSFIFILILTNNINSFTQISNAIGEEELFKKRKEKSNISLGFEFMLTQNSRYYSRILQSTTDDELLQAGLALRGYFPISEKLVAQLYLPFLIKSGFVEKEKLPDTYDFKLNYGIGDFVADVSYIIFSQSSFPVNLISQLELLVPLGQSRFDSEYEGYLPLGSGFQSVNFGAGLSRTLSSKSSLFVNGGYVLRFSNEFKSDNYNNFYISQGGDYNPDDMYFIRGGIGFLLKIFNQDHIINFEVEHFSVGEINFENSQFKEWNQKLIMEPSFKATRYGIKLISPNEKDEPASIFLGLEKRDYDDTFGSFFDDKETNTFLINITAPLGFKIFSYEF